MIEPSSSNWPLKICQGTKMNKKPENPLDALGPLHRFTHEAMATVFEIVISGQDKTYACQAAMAAFDELDRLEGLLSRYISNSEISQLNRLQVGKSLPLSLETLECLTISIDIYEQTNHAFDITVGSLLKCLLDKDRNLLTPTPEQLKIAMEHTGSDLIKLNQDEFAVQILTSPLKVDLGAIGKGFALDKMAEILKEWSIDSALIHGGGSTVLALDPPANAPGFPITVSSPTDRKKKLHRINLANQAFSTSGLIRGSHIIDPRIAKPVESKFSAWAIAPTGAVADALSTAFIVMSTEEIESYCKEHKEIKAMIAIKDKSYTPVKEKILRFGDWPK